MLADFQRTRANIILISEYSVIVFDNPFGKVATLRLLLLLLVLANVRRVRQCFRILTNSISPRTTARELAGSTAVSLVPFPPLQSAAGYGLSI